MPRKRTRKDLIEDSSGQDDDDEPKSKQSLRTRNPPKKKNTEIPQVRNAYAIINPY